LQIRLVPNSTFAEDAYEVEIVDYKGQVQLKQELQGTQKLDLGNLSQGLYQVVIRQHGMVIKSQKQVIRK